MAAGGGGSDPVEDLLSCSWWWWEPGGGFTHWLPPTLTQGLLDTVNTKLEVHFHSLFMIYHEECAEENRQSKVPAVGKSWCVQLSGWERGTDQWSG